MSNIKFCPECGAEIAPTDRFCGDCGFDTQKTLSTTSAQTVKNPEATVLPSAGVDQSSPTAAPAPKNSLGSEPRQPAGSQFGSGGSLSPPLGTKPGGNKNALLIMISLLAFLFLGGGGLYWWFSQGEEPGKSSSVPSTSQQQNSGAATPITQNNGTSSAQPAQPEPNVAVDLSRAAAYLSDPGYKYTAFVNYPDGTAGVVERISAQIVSDEAVRVSEVETGVERGETFGYGFHYVERPDGTYYILDESPYEIYPVLKNSLTVGKSWNYQDEFGQITWTVLDMGVDLNLGFATFKDCLLVKEDNQAADFQSITYYAPGRGIVLVKNLSGTVEHYKLTDLTRLDAAQAAATVKKWSPNYAGIKDDRTQN